MEMMKISEKLESGCVMLTRDPRVNLDCLFLWDENGIKLYFWIKVNNSQYLKSKGSDTLRPLRISI